jgi:KipI family sensor histidine kinase inhibitor
VESLRAWEFILQAYSLMTNTLASAPQLDHSAGKLTLYLELPCAMTPEICTLGHDALLIRFAREANETATACVQVMLHMIEDAHLANVIEIAPALASVMVRFIGGHDARMSLHQQLSHLLETTDWSTVAVPAAKRRWIIPICFDGDAAPHLAEVAQIVGKSEAAIIHDLGNTDLRVLALGFAPGQPYVGLLPHEWDMPRTSTLTAEVPAGALVTAVRQLVLFANPSPTGWRQIGMSAFKPFAPNTPTPILLRAGDAMQFSTATADDIQRLKASGDPKGGAICQPL